MPNRPRAAASLAVINLIAVITASACDGLDPLEAQRALVEGSEPDLIIEWNQLAYDLAYAEDQFLTFKGQRAIAMLHLAVHDALQAIVPLYESHAYHDSAPGADYRAAAARAAHDVLAAVYPNEGARLATQLERSLDSIDDTAARTAGERAGAAAASTLIARRANDGWDGTVEYAYRAGPGEYQSTPPWDGFTLVPGFRNARPFSFDDPAQFRPAPPPALTSTAYAAAHEEVRLQGDSTSAVRTPDQTGYAVWWMEFSESSVGRLARRLVAERSLDLWAANRMFAHLYVALYDGYIANWDSKYEYNHWRPYTSIRQADGDGNAETIADASWAPLRPTPPFPEYASAHATGCAAAYEVMAEVFGNATAFENTSLTAPAGMSTRSFPSFSAAAEECADSRVQLGWHYRYATDAGLLLGRTVARHVMQTTLRVRP